MSPNRERYRVIQWATGSIGQIAIRQREQPDLRAGRRLRDERRQARGAARARLQGSLRSAWFARPTSNRSSRSTPTA